MLILLACAPGVSDTSASPDLVADLGPDEVRAGVVTDAAALFGGVAAEGRLGDVKLYNDRVRFVIQQPGPSNYYHEYGGSLIDADVVRPAGQPGRDLIDEHAVMVGLGRVVDVESVTVLEDGRDGVARVRTEGPTAPLHLLTGALESPGLVADLDLRVTTEYTLRPGEWSMEVTTTVENRDADAVLQIGAITIVAMEIADPWTPGLGRSGPDEDPVDWTAVVGQRNEGAVALLGAGAPLEQGAIGAILGAIAPTIGGFGPTEPLASGASMTWTHRIGAGPDPATLSSEQQRPLGGQLLSGVTVPGARVHLLQAGAPVTLAFADTSGAWEAIVPPGPTEIVVTGRGRGIHVDLPEGHGNVSPYEVDQAATLATLAEGADPIAFADGWGVDLVPPAEVQLTIADGGPAVARFYFQDGDPVVADERLVPGRPSGCAAIAYVRDGSMTVPVEPGAYTLVVNRGVRDEIAVVPLTLTSGVTEAVTVDLPRAWSVEGVVVGDPHSHAAPSGDGGISMEDRLVVAAANGLDLHFGTDHDHIADYRPLLAPLGLDLRSVLAVEVSPVLRGHFNVWPAVASDGPNHGAPPWWLGVTDTAELFGWMREIAGEAGVIQANHPVGDSGMFSFAGLSSGTVADPDRWSDDFDAMEVLNSGDWTNNLPFYLDLVNRGHPVVPVGVSDSHSHTGGRVGLDVTFFHIAGELTDDALRETMAAGATAVGEGLFVHVTRDGEWLPGRLVEPGRIDVTVHHPSWMPADTLTLWRDGEAVEVAECCTASWEVVPEADAAYVVTADSATSLSWVEPGVYPWGLAAAIKVDADGDGLWTPPATPLR